MRPSLAVVQRARSGQPRAGGSGGDVAAGGDVPGDLVRAGDGAGIFVHGEVVQGEPALDGGQQRVRLDHRLVPGPGDRIAQVSGAVGRIGVPGELPARVVMVTAAGVRPGCHRTSNRTASAVSRSL